MKKEIITIAGRLGSGKSSTANLVAEHLGYKRFSSGDFMRAMAEKRGITLEELSNEAQKDPAVDREIDEQNIIAGKENNLVVDSRLAFHFIPNSFKVYLYLSPEIAAQRIADDAKQNEWRHKETTSDMSNVSEIAKSIARRFESENERYKTIYGIDQTDQTKFDLIIDTSEVPLEEVAEKIIKNYQIWLEK